MFERVLLLLAVAALVFAAIVLVRAIASVRRRRLLQDSPEPLWDSLGMQPDGRPTLVAFSTPSCAACHTAQAPAVQLVQASLGSAKLRVVSIDAASQPLVAKTFGIMTVPSTVVLAPSGQVLAINHGFTASEKLSRQLAATS
jgi:thiol-disulfide isomerase/thioredoxin